MNRYILLNFFLVGFVASSSIFYLGMFKRHDYLVGKDRIYKPKGPLKYNYLKYGRLFKCPITYFRLSNREDSNQVSPHVKIIRGGLGKKYIAVKVWVYNAPIDVLAYVGCDGSVATTKPSPTTSTTEGTTVATTSEAATEAASEDASEAAVTTEAAAGGDTTAAGDATEPSSSAAPPAEK